MDGYECFWKGNCQFECAGCEYYFPCECEDYMDIDYEIDMVLRIVDYREFCDEAM